MTEWGAGAPAALSRGLRTSGPEYSGRPAGPGGWAHCDAPRLCVTPRPGSWALSLGTGLALISEKPRCRPLAKLGSAPVPNACCVVWGVPEPQGARPSVPSAVPRPPTGLVLPGPPRWPSDGAGLQRSPLPPEAGQDGAGTEPEPPGGPQPCPVRLHDRKVWESAGSGHPHVHWAPTQPGAPRCLLRPPGPVGRKRSLVGGRLPWSARGGCGRSLQDGGQAA